MRSLTLQSPAKLNLYLKVINKRPDGFHNIKTIFQRVSLLDEIKMTSNPSGKIKIICDNPHVPKGPKNLVYKVARNYKDSFGIREGITIKIKKRIPVAAGLAGGSSNAAAALLGLNKLWGLKLNKKIMLDLASKLGSDISFFINDCSLAVGTGKGDIIRKIRAGNKRWYIIVVPRIKMYSSKVYGTLKLKLTKGNDNVTILIHNLKKYNILNISKNMFNDLEEPVLRLEPRLRILKERLKALEVKGVMISGSGPAVFGLVDSERHGFEVKNKLEKIYSRVFVVSSL